MFAIRPAIAVILLSLCHSPSAFAAESTESPASGAVFATARVCSSIACPVGLAFPRSSSLARFAPWKARPKIVLEETNHQFREESDSGLALVLSTFSSPPCIATTTPRAATMSPLRC